MEYIQAIKSAAPGRQQQQRAEDAKPRLQKKNVFADWLGPAPGNVNDEPFAPPLLSLEDELMLGSMRERARLFTSPQSARKILPPQNAYDAYQSYAHQIDARSTADYIEYAHEPEDQYAFSFMLPFPVELDQEV